MSIPYETLQELYEIADGARGDGPWMRGLAIDHIRKNGHEYPAKPEHEGSPRDSTTPSQERNTP